MKSLKRKNSSKLTVLNSKRTDMKDDKNEIIVDTNGFGLHENWKKLNCSKVCRKEFQELGNKIQRAETDNFPENFV